MATVEMVMPKMGESVMEGTVLAWLKNVGETIEEDESILEVATDKVDTEIPATHAGVLKEVLAQEGDVVEVGKPIAIIETEGDSNGAAPAPAESPKEEPAPVEQAEAMVETAMSTASSSNGTAVPRTSDSGKFFSPLVRSIAKEEGISVAELESINGTGKDGRVTKNDILSYVENRKSGGAPTPSAQPAAAPAMPSASHQPMPVAVDGGDEIIEMDRMRKMIAERMVASKHISPHVTSFVEADVTKVVAWRNKVKNEFLNRESEKLTFTPILIEAIVRAIKDFPMINVQVDGNNIVKKKAINIGMATALPTGNLIVPVIHNADQLSLVGITKKVNDLAKRARENKLKPDELQGGTYTVSNVGSFGNVMGTPIIMQPQVAIMALGAIQKKPSVVETPEGDMIGIRSKMFLSHSYDHRVVDGALGGMFVRKVADYLEEYDLNRGI
ncbi:dihydrolipoamide acetyltransferase family protein [Ekhidna sp. MALMAid0563]|uniref:dihydrolipoamide acetyltransferase family protein n=1 Tax=Ekhidna sp. MALMAid0563 TaxID=3143937 RepID=UPI0032E0289E